MAKPAKKIPRPTSPETPTALLHPTPGQPGTSTADTGANPHPNNPHTLPGAPAPRPSVIISPAPASRIAASTARVTDSRVLPPVHSKPSALSGTSSSERFSPPVYINSASVLQLKRKANDAEGFLYDKRNKPYVELPDGVVMVGRSADGWRQTFAGESTPTGQRVEKIPGSTLWREVDPLIAEPAHVLAMPARRISAQEQALAASDTRALSHDPDLPLLARQGQQ